MNESVAGAFIGLVMSPLVLAVLYVTIQGAATGPPDRYGLTGIRIKATRRSDAAWTAGHRAALPVARRVIVGVLLIDVLAVVLLFVGPAWLMPWLGVLPAVAVLVGMIPIVRAATKAANAAPEA